VANYTNINISSSSRSDNRHAHVRHFVVHFLHTYTSVNTRNVNILLKNNDSKLILIIMVVDGGDYG
jgi:hypothetical protein